MSKNCEIGEESRSGKISVIVPVYNVENYIEDCLKSLTGQTYRNLEILLIDDGSADRSSQICAAWERKDERIRLIRKENGGVSSARNCGLEAMSGEYYAFVDADDWLKADMLERQEACIRDLACDMVLCGYETTGRRMEKDISMEKGVSMKKDASVEQNVFRQNVCKETDVVYTVDRQTYITRYLLEGNTRCWSILYRRAKTGPVRFISGLTIGEDMLYLMDLLPSLERVAVMDYRGYCYYLNSGGAMFSDFRSSYMDQITCWELARRRLRQLYPEGLVLLDRNLFMAALLTAGKLAGVPARERSGFCEEVSRCLTAAKAAWSDREVRKSLSVGYRLKGSLFLHMPKLYLALYHLWKSGNAHEK